MVERFREVSQELKDLRRKRARELRAQRRLARQAAREATGAERKATRVAEFQAAQPQLVADLMQVQDGVGFLYEMRRSLEQYGSLSPNQAVAAIKALSQAKERAEKAARAQPMPVFGERRVRIEGLVLTTRVDRDERFYPVKYTTKMLVEHDDGWKVWGTVPDVINGDLKGRRVSFEARVERSNNDDKFGFFKRPTKVAVRGE